MQELLEVIYKISHPPILNFIAGHTYNGLSRVATRVARICDVDLHGAVGCHVHSDRGLGLGHTGCVTDLLRRYVGIANAPDEGLIRCSSTKKRLWWNAS